MRTLLLVSIFFLIFTTATSAQIKRDRWKNKNEQKKTDLRWQHLLKSYDTDQDSKISKAEFTHMSENRWTKLDLDQNNIVTEEELKKCPDYLKEIGQDHEIFQKFDKNKDSKITADEISSLPLKIRQAVERNDTNQDGTISLGEYLQAFSKRIFQKFDKNKNDLLEVDEMKNPKMFKNLDKDQNQTLTLEEFKQISLMKFFLNHDQNQDGKVTRDEYLNSQKMRFEKADKNKDGFISQDDFSKDNATTTSQPTTTETEERAIEEELEEILMGTPPTEESTDFLDGF